MSGELFRRTRAAEKADVSPNTLRFYEENELLEHIQRSTSGYRMYSEEDIQRVKFIKICQKIGFQLSEIKQLLELVDEDSEDTCEAVSGLTKNKLLVVREKIKGLKEIESVLKNLIGTCSEVGRECSIIEELLTRLDNEAVNE